MFHGSVHRFDREFAHARRRSALCLTVFAGLLIATAGRAQGDPSATDSDEPPKPRFGQAGQVAISGAFSLDLGNLSFTETEQSSFSLEINPSAHYFVSENLSIGGSVSMRYRSATYPLTEREPVVSFDESSLGFGVSAIVGLNLPASERVSFWPRASIAVSTDKLTAPSTLGLAVNRNGQYVPYGDMRETAIAAQLWVPLLYHPTAHLFLGFGPMAYVDLYHSVEEFTNRRIFFGATSLVGGWF